MRLIPKSFFFTLVFFGLPFAISIGWALGETTPITPPAAATPDGSGGLGAAPARNKPVRPVDYPERTADARPRSTTAPARVWPRTTDPVSPPAPTVPSQSQSQSHPPPPIEPSEPAPSMIPSESTLSPEPSAIPSADPSGIDVNRDLHNY